MSAKVYQIEDRGYAYPAVFWDLEAWIKNPDSIPPDMQKRIKRKVALDEKSRPADDWKNKAYLSRGEFVHILDSKLLYLLQNPLDPDEWFFMDASFCRGGSKQDYIHKMFIGQIK